MSRPKGSKNKKIISLKERLYSKISIDSETNCWNMIPFKGHRYPKIQINKKCERAHRVSYEITYGLIPKEFHCLHKCDNTHCINPNHLFLGTHKENMHDMIKKNRDKKDGPKGTRCAQHILDDEKVIQILNLLKKGRTQIYIARKYHVSQQNISRIKNNKQWQHISRG